MNPNKPGIFDDKFKLPHVLAVCHRGTQTKDSSPKDSIQSTISKSICTDACDERCSSDEGSIKLFEFSQILQDTDHPENITIIKDTFSEEIREHSTASDTTANRYKYCREIIQPFLKDYSACTPVSDDEVIKDVLKSVQKDFPDYQPCFETNNSSINICDSDSKLDKAKRIKNRKDSDEDPFLCCEKLHSGAQPANASSGGNVFIPIRACERPDNKKNKKDKEETDSTCSFICGGKKGDISEDICNMDKDAKKKGGSKDPTQDDYDDPYDPCRKPPCPRKSICPEGIKPCKKPRNDPKVPPAPFCSDDSGPACHRKLTTGCESADDLKDMAKKAKASCKSGSGVQLPPASTPPPQKSVMEAHCEALETIKVAASCAMCKVAEVTKDTVSLIRTESAKQLEKLKAFGSDCDNVCESSSKKSDKKKNSKDTGVTEVTNILGTKNIMENLQQLQKVDAEDILHKMVEKMESTVSMISENIDLDTIASILKSDDADTSPRTPTRDFVRHLSREKLHAAEEPKEVKKAVSNTASNMFTTIKSKIFSYFSDINKGAENPENPEISDEEDDK